jgi:hypothetical protein
MILTIPKPTSWWNGGSSPVETHDQWLCSDCGKRIEGQFT